VKEKYKFVVDLLQRVSVLFLLISVFLCLSAVAGFADDRIDLRLKHKPVSSRMAVPRLALGSLKEKEKETELQVVKKRVSNEKARTRVKKSDRQRKKKTKRVVASQ
jgi:UDP-N-acetylmuramyl pentapeptide phosphotransferase/UDP-N-acetylglucosamine-1-phosphate transferase